MKFPIESVARDYLWERYPRATNAEKEKYVRDWVNKVDVSRAILKDFQARVGSVSGKKFLDYGCGNGGISIVFSEAGADVLGVEVEQELFDISKKHAESFGSNAKFILYDGNRLPIESNTYDLAISVSVLEHTSDPKLYLEEVLRVLKVGGQLYLAFPNRLWPKETHTGLWFVTYLPNFLIARVIRLFGRNPVEDNSLHFYGYWSLLGFIAPKKDQPYYFKIVPEVGKSKSFVKLVIKKVLGFFGISYRAFLPHVAVTLRKENSESSKQK